jgi:hypothetical protein
VAEGKWDWIDRARVGVCMTATLFASLFKYHSLGRAAQVVVVEDATVLSVGTEDLPGYLDLRVL